MLNETHLSGMAIIMCNNIVNRENDKCKCINQSQCQSQNNGTKNYLVQFDMQIVWIFILFKMNRIEKMFSLLLCLINFSHSKSWAQRHYASHHMCVCFVFFFIIFFFIFHFHSMAKKAGGWRNNMCTFFDSLYHNEHKWQ